MQRLASRPVYPFLIAALPLLHYYAKDLGSAAPGPLVRMLVAYWSTTAMLLLLARRIWRDGARAALVCGACAAPLFYGGSLEWPRLFVVVVAVAVLTLVVHRLPRGLSRWTPILNVACVVLVSLPIASIAWRLAKMRSPRAVTGYADPVPLPAVDERPDIYFILADGLAHPAIFQSMYGVARESFEAPLHALGFHFVAGSRSNYAQTALSLSATLNMAYVQDLLEIPDPLNDDRRPLARLIAHNRVVNTLRSTGYRIASLPAEYPLAQPADADLVRKPLLSLGFFELHTLRNSILPHVERLAGRGPADLEFALHRQRVEFVLRELPRLRTTIPADEPLFVFAHIVAPHPPFVYGRHGEPQPSRQRFSFADGDHWLMERHGIREQYVVEYRDQARYIVEQIAVAADAIIRSAPRPLVIIVQSDHGPGSELRWDNLQLTNRIERHGIFNAWFASRNVAVPPAGMTAVNTFRFLFNSQFGATLPLQDDRAWYSRWIWPYEFSELPRIR